MADLACSGSARDLPGAEGQSEEALRFLQAIVKVCHLDDLSEPREPHSRARGKRAPLRRALPRGRRKARGAQEAEALIGKARRVRACSSASSRGTQYQVTLTCRREGHVRPN